MPTIYQQQDFEQLENMGVQPTHDEYIFGTLEMSEAIWERSMSV